MPVEVIVSESVGESFSQLLIADYKARNNALFTIALSGGSSAEVCYPPLLELNAEQIDWEQVEIFWSDERMVPIEDEMSNAGAAEKIFLNKLDPQPRIFAMNADDGPDTYEFLLRTRPPLDLVHLGVGPDGHTASLFPNSTALHESERFVVENTDPSGLNKLPRMTLTFPGIENSNHVVFTAFGQGKAEIVKRVLSGEDLPAAAVNAPRVTWVLDKAAASLLPADILPN